MVLHDGAALLLAALPQEHLGQRLFTHSTGKETEAQRGCVVEVQVRMGLEATSNSTLEETLSLCSY